MQVGERSEHMRVGFFERSEKMPGSQPAPNLD